MNIAYRLVLLVLVCAFSTSYGSAQDEFQRVIDLIKPKDPDFKEILIAPQPQAVVANAQVRASAAEWIKKVVRPDWLPSDIQDRLEPERRRWECARSYTDDVFHLKISVGMGTIDLYESSVLSIMWRDKDISIGMQPESQVRLCLKAILKDYPSDSKFLMESHQGGKLISGTLSRPDRAVIPSRWNDIVWFWIADGVFLFRVYESTPESAARAAKQAKLDGGDQLRFEPTDKGSSK